MNYLDKIFQEHKEHPLSADDFMQRIGGDFYQDKNYLLKDKSVLAQYPQFVMDTIMIVEMDVELQMNGIWGFIENSTVEWLDETIDAFAHISAEIDANVLRSIRNLIDPKQLRTDLSKPDLKEYEMTSFDSNHNISDEVLDEIKELSYQLYLYAEHDIWGLLEAYIEKEMNQINEFFGQR